MPTQPNQCISSFIDRDCLFNQVSWDKVHVTSVHAYVCVCMRMCNLGFEGIHCNLVSYFVVVLFKQVHKVENMYFKLNEAEILTGFMCWCKGYRFESM